MKIKISRLKIVTEKAPFILTILFAALGWTVDRLATELPKSPVLRYAVESCEGDKETVYSLKNISRFTRFEDIRLFVYWDNNTTVSCVREPNITFSPPVYLMSPTEEKNYRPKCISDEYAEFKLKELQPGAHVKLHVYLNSFASTHLRVQSNKPLLLKKSSIKTFVVENQIAILVIVAIAWLFVILSFFVNVEYSTKPEKNEETDNA